MVYLPWMWESWRILYPGSWVYPVLALVAVGCGLLVGTERQRREKPAGLRTITLVCLGSAVFTMVSFAFTTTTGDSGRVSAQIVTGIGFLGAGVIMRSNRKISGTTTAATIWMTAAIGMTAGAGFVLAALGLSLLVNRLLTFMFLYETEWHPDLQHACVVIEFGNRGGITRVRLERILVDYNLAGATAVWAEPTPEMGRLTLTLRLPRVHLYELLSEVVDVPEVHSLQQEVCPVAARPTLT